MHTSAPIAVITSANIHANPSRRSTSSSPSDGTHATLSRRTPPLLTWGNSRTNCTAVAMATRPAKLASTVLARVGSSAVTTLPMNGRSSRTIRDMAPLYRHPLPAAKANRHPAATSAADAACHANIPRVRQRMGATRSRSMRSGLPGGAPGGDHICVQIVATAWVATKSRVRVKVLMAPRFSVTSAMGLATPRTPVAAILRRRLQCRRREQSGLRQ